MRRARTDQLPDVFLGRDAVAAGVLTPDELRGPSVRRLLQGVYAPTGVVDTHELRCAAAGLVLAPGSMLTGRSAATVLGVPLADREDAVEVLCAEGVRTGLRRGVLVRRAVEMPDSTATWRGVPLAPSERIAFDLAARHRLPEAVGHLDAFARAGLLDLDVWRAGLADVHVHDVVAVRTAAALADPRAQSRPESHLRVLLATAGIPVEPQVEVRLPGGALARLDLAVAARRVGIEYDGAWHALREQLAKDRYRLNALAAAGWTIVHVTADLLARPRDVVALVRSALAGHPNRRVSGL